MSNPQFFTRNDIHRLYRRIAKTTHVVLKCQFFRFSKTQPACYLVNRDTRFYLILGILKIM